ncbi:hypothetical protein GGR50DRAFT_674121, partial [Xylaria sp. CBS 124048]
MLRRRRVLLHIMWLVPLQDPTRRDVEHNDINEQHAKHVTTNIRSGDNTRGRLRRSSHAKQRRWAQARLPYGTPTTLDLSSKHIRTVPVDVEMHSFLVLSSSRTRAKLFFIYYYS